MSAQPKKSAPRFDRETYASLVEKVEAQAVICFARGLEQTERTVRRCFHDDAKRLAELALALRMRAPKPVIARQIYRFDTALRDRLPASLCELYWQELDRRRTGGVA